MAHRRATADIIDIPTHFNAHWSDFKTDSAPFTDAQFAQLFQAQNRLHRRIEYLHMRIAHLNQCLEHETTSASF